jgi:hypothetical protein
MRTHGAVSGGLAAIVAIVALGSAGAPPLQKGATPWP